MRKVIPLTFAQKEIMSEFYRADKEKILLGKTARNDLWDFVRRNNVPQDLMRKFDKHCPALAHQIRQHEANCNNVQSAVFSECVYAQALANIFRLVVFKNCLLDSSFIPLNVMSLLDSYYLKPRYAYISSDARRMLIQAGGCGGVDSALITVFDLKAFTIEFKEPGAKTSEPDLPKYGEDGQIVITNVFLSRYPQFGPMLEEKRGLNFFDVMGSNVNDFSYDSINVAVSNNYNTKKFADVVCTESVDEYLVMMPINQVDIWARIEGEIRPAGRNHYPVWTSVALRRFLGQKGAQIEGNTVSICVSNLKPVKPRGGVGVSRYKINPLFFVFARDCNIEKGVARFQMSSVRQLNPTIAGKMFFENLRYEEVRRHYFQQALAN